MIKKFIAFWNALPPKTQQWIKGAEVAIVTAIVAACIGAPASDFTTKKGIAEFASGVLAAAYGALRLYLTQPIPVGIEQKTTDSETKAVGDVSVTKSTTTETSTK